MKFTKLHGCGNDYLYVDCITQPEPADPAAAARAMSDRHYGVGSDGLILALPSQKADLRMRMFNADGSEGQMCGNGIRGLAKFVFDRKLVLSNPMRVETLRGILNIDQLLDSAGRVECSTVDMDEPILNLASIPVSQEFLTKVGQHVYTLQVEGAGGAEKRQMSFISMGSAHAVEFMGAAQFEQTDLNTVGPKIELHRAFPNRVNYHAVSVINRSEVRMKTWERGSGITLACGTGACAVAVAGVLTSQLDRKVTTHLPGGDLKIEWRESNNHVYMTGPSVEVFSGEWNG